MSSRSKKKAATKHGILLVDKEAGGTSHDVVQKARRLIREKKIGHCGTLDPAATGLLVLTVGRATRLTRFLIRAPKVYEGTIRLGAATTTYDAEGEITSEASTEDITFEAVRDAMASFEGSYLQVPPAYSAKKVKGVKLYELARRGEEVPEEAQEGKEVRVHEFVPQTDGFSSEDPLEVRFRLGCASGTYARSLAHDVGRKLGCGAHLSSLRRLSVGPFEVTDALTLGEMADALGDSLSSDEGENEDGWQDGRALGPAWVSFDDIPLPFAEVVLDTKQEQRIHHGQTVLVRDLAGEEGDWIKLADRRRRFVAVGTLVERIGAGGVGIVQPKVVFK